MREAVEMKNPTELYYCQPVEVNIISIIDIFLIDSN